MHDMHAHRPLRTLAPAQVRAFVTRGLVLAPVFLDNRSEICLIKGVGSRWFDRLEIGMKALLTEALLPSDLIAIGILFGIVGTLLVAYLWDLTSIMIAERSSAREWQHWKTTIREER